MKYAVKATPKEKDFFTHFIVVVEAENSKQALAIAHSIVLDYHTEDFTWETRQESLAIAPELLKGWWF